jgi:hypothetical protein
MTRGKEFLGITVKPKMTFILRATAALAFLLIITAGTQAQAQTCRQHTNIPTQNLIDLNNSTVTNLGSNNFRIHFVYVSDPSITLICADSGQQAPCGFDGVYFRMDLSSTNILAESGGGSCNLKSTITTDGTSPVAIQYELKFELNGVPSKQLFDPAGAACLTTDPNVIGVGQTLSLAKLLC